MKSMESKPQLLRLYRLNRKGSLLALALFFLFLLIFRFRVFTGLNTYYLGGSHADAGLYFYLFRHHLSHFFSSPWFDLHAFIPYPLALAWSDNFILPAMLAIPFYLIGLPETVLYNALLLITHLLLGYTTYRVTFLIAGREKISLFSGGAALSLAYFTHSLGHPQLQFAFCFPLAIELLLRGINRPFLSGVWFGGLVISMFLTTVYYSLFLLLFPPAFYVALFAVHPRRDFLKVVGKFFLGGTALSPLLLPFLFPYQEIKAVFGARDLYEMYAFRATTDSLFSAPPLSLLYGASSSLSHAEAHFFPGLILLFTPFISFFRIGNAKPLKSAKWLALSTLTLTFLLASPSFLHLMGLSTTLVQGIQTFGVPIGCYLSLASLLFLGSQLGRTERLVQVKFITTRALLFTLLFTMIFFFFFSLGPTTSPESSSLQLSLFSLTYSLLPGFDAARAISRAAVPALLIIPILSALSIGLISQHGRAALFRHTALLPCLFLFVVLENSLSNYALEPRDGAPVAASHLLALQSENDVTIFLPFTDELKSDGSVKSWRNFAHRNVDFMNWSLDLNLKVVNGYSGQRTKIMRELPGECKNFPDMTCIHALSAIGNLRYIVFESKHITNFNKEAFLAKYEGLKDQLTLLEQDGEGYFLFRLAPMTKPSHLVTIRALPRFSRREGAVLSFEVKMPYEENQPPLSLLLFERDHVNRPIGSWNLSQDGNWHDIHLTTDLLPKKSVPFRFEFTSDPKHRLQVREFSLKS